LTGETLCRMWCAGEIVSAVRHKIPIVIVTTETYTPPTEEWLDELRQLWTPQQFTTLASYGVELEDIREAYKTILQLPTIPFNSFGSTEDFETCVAAILKASTGIISTAAKLTDNMGERSASGELSLTPEVLLVGRPNDGEAVCTARVLQLLLQKAMCRSVLVVYTADALRNHMQLCKYLVVVLTRGLLDSPDFARTLHAAEGIALVPVLADTSFSYPDSSYYDKMLLGEIFPLDSPVAKEIGVDNICNLYKKLFTILALTFTSHGSEHIQGAEVKGLMARFRWEKMDQARSMDSRESDGKVEKGEPRESIDIEPCKTIEDFSPDESSWL